MISLKTWNAFVDLIFPRVCIGCKRHLNFYEKILCIGCRLDLPLTHFQKNQKNPLFQKLKLNFPLENASALFYFEKEGKVAQMIHQFKYLDQRHLGVYLGHWLGDTLLESSNLKKSGWHHSGSASSVKKEKKRVQPSSNPSRGIIGKTESSPVKKTLIRVKRTQSLAQIGYDERWREVDQAFEFNKPLPKEMKHVLLVDDVITTGATLTACARALLKKNPLKLSIVSLACRL